MRALRAVLPALLAASCRCSEWDGRSFDGELRETVNQTFAVRLFTSTGPVGFGTPTPSRSTAPLYFFRGTEDAAATIGGLERGVVAVVSSRTFDADFAQLMRRSGRCSGIVVLDDGAPEAGFSPEAASSSGGPNGFGDPFNASYPWNPLGSGLLYEDFPFPMVLALGSSNQDLRARAQQNRDRGLGAPRLWVADLDFYFGRPRAAEPTSGAGGSAAPGPEPLTSVDCLRWVDPDGSLSPKCLPVGGQSAWAFFGVPDARPKAFLAGNLDATALFHERARGADAAAATVVALLVAAELLADSGADLDALEMQIGLGLFQAEAFGRSGSRRFFRDISGAFSCAHEAPPAIGFPRGAPGACGDPVAPSGAFRSLSLGRFGAVIAATGLGVSGSADLYLHAAPNANATDLRDRLLSLDDPSYARLRASSAPPGAVPPSPLLSAASYRQDLAGVVLSAFDGAYSSKVQHSQHDEASRGDFSAESVARAATTLARAALVAASGSSGAVDGAAARALVPGAPIGRVEELVDCLTSDWSCEAMRSVYSSAFADLFEHVGGTFRVAVPAPPSFYAGVLSANLGGQPVLQHRLSGGSFGVFGRFPNASAFDNASDVLYAVPSALEAFARGALLGATTAYNATVQRSLRTANGSAEGCRSAADCGPCGEQDRFWGEDPPANASVQQECLPGGHCACPTAFHHLALDPAAVAVEAPNVFEVDAEEVERGAPLWTEPYWSPGVGMRVRPVVGAPVAVAALVLGLFFIVGCALAARALGGLLRKEKVL